MHFSLGTTDELNVCHTLNHREPVAELVVCVVVQLVDRHITNERHRGHGLGVDVELLNDRVFDVLGQFGADEVDFFADVRGRDIHIHTHFEFQQRLAHVLHADG